MLYYKSSEGQRVKSSKRFLKEIQLTTIRQPCKELQGVSKIRLAIDTTKTALWIKLTLNLKE